MIERRSAAPIAERLGLFVGIAIVAMMAFTTVAPFFVASIPPTSVRLIDQQQTILQSVFMVLAGYCYGRNASSAAKDATISNLVKATVPPPPDSVVTTTTTTEEPKP